MSNILRILMRQKNRKVLRMQKSRHLQKLTMGSSGNPAWLFWTNCLALVIKRLLVPRLVLTVKQTMLLRKILELDAPNW